MCKLSKTFSRNSGKNVKKILTKFYRNTSMIAYSLSIKFFDTSAPSGCWVPIIYLAYLRRYHKCNFFIIHGVRHWYLTCHLKCFNEKFENRIFQITFFENLNEIFRKLRKIILNERNLDKFRYFEVIYGKTVRNQGKIILR